jgi:hypothetical protein
MTGMAVTHGTWMVLIISREILERSDNPESICGVQDSKFDLHWRI